MMTPLAIGVDVGGTKIAFVLTDEQGTVLATHHLPTLPTEGAAAVIDRVGEGVRALLEQANGQVMGIGIGCPGRVDSDRGVVYNAVNLGWTNVDLGGETRKRLPIDLPLWVENDGNAEALGEMYYGAARGCNDFMYFAVGTGLGGGAVSGGRVITGATYYPTEVGHLSLNPDGRLCTCGLHGCPEIYISGTGMMAGARERRHEFPDSALAQKERPTTAEILNAASEQDPLALAVLDDAGRWLGAIMACCAGILNPALIIVGGGLGHAAGTYLLPTAERELKRRVVRHTYEALTIIPSQVTVSAMGAAALVWHQQAIRKTSS
jgi:glucokinase